MPQSTKQGQRQLATPSPTPGDILNTLLIVKDAVNSTLLNEHTRFADLSNVLSEVENQLRDVFEGTIKSLKTEIEKRKRRIVPGIKKLQELLKSLSKSETKCKTSEKGYKNAVTKKAKRRIKDTQKYLKEFITSDSELGIPLFLSDQITALCQKLMHIPSSIRSFKTEIEVCKTPQLYDSESDSESSRSASRTTTPVDPIYNRTTTPVDPIYNEIEVSQTSLSFQKLKNDLMKDVSDNRPTGRPKLKKQPATTTNSRLNSVVLFSTDSDSSEGEKKPNRHTKSADDAPSRPFAYTKHKMNKSSDLHSSVPDYEQLLRPDIEDVFKNFSNDKHETSQNDLPTNASPVVSDDYEKPIKSPKDNMPTVHTCERASPYQEHHAKQTANTSSPPKRLLPAIPKLRQTEGRIKTPAPSSKPLTTHIFTDIPIEGMDFTDSSDPTDACLDNIAMANSTVELLAAADDLIKNMKAPSDEEDVDFNANFENNEIKQATKTLPQDNVENKILIEPDYVDVEEIKFRETVRTARREIIDRLKNRRVHNDEQIDNDNSQRSFFASETSSNSVVNKFHSFSPPQRTCLKHSQQMDNTIPSSIHNGERDVRGIKHDAGSSLAFSKANKNNQSDNSSNDSSIKGLFKSRLIHTYGPDRHTPSFEYRHMDMNQTAVDYNQSMVSAAIEKFESASDASSHSVNRTSRKAKPNAKYNQFVKHRSSSEPRGSSRFSNNPASSINKRKQSDGEKQLKPQNTSNALLPRSTTISNDNVFDDKPNILSKSSTESDLLKLISNESASSIRKKWSRRRSLSVTPKATAVVTNNCHKTGPVFEPHGSIVLPDHSTRCYISSIVVIQNDSLVFLDETHGYLHLYDRFHKHKDSYRLLDTPKCCIKVNESTVAVAFPFKKHICLFNITMGAILADRQINAPCSEWILAIAFSGNLYYVLCKDGDMHVLTPDGKQRNVICLGMSGQIFVPSPGNRLFIMGENKINKFNAQGVLLTSKSGIDAHSMIIIENKTYIADRQSHKIVPLADTGNVLNLTANRLAYPLAMCCSANESYLFVSQFEDSMEVPLTRTIQVFKKTHK